jgi:uncharacterized membrane protein
MEGTQVYRKQVEMTFSKIHTTAKYFIKLSSIIVILIVATLAIPTVYAQVDEAIAQDQHALQAVREPETVQGTIIKILEEKELTVNLQKQKYQRIQVKITKGSGTGSVIEIENGGDFSLQQVEYQVGDQLFLSLLDSGSESQKYLIAGINRARSLWLLFGLFVLVSIIVGSKKGIYSLLAMGVSLLVLLVIIIPLIQAGKDPMLSTITGALIIIPVTFYLSHGFNKKTTVAVLATFISIVVTGLLSFVFINLARLTGMTDDETMMLQSQGNLLYNLKGLLLAGVVIGALGVLDDITTAQSAVAFQLFEVNSRMRPWELFKRSTEIGKDHIASMINTLVLAYTGASLPLVLLFVSDSRPIIEIASYEMIAVEIIRTLVGSIGLIIAVPVTNMIACFVIYRGAPYGRSIREQYGVDRR